jgi:hypothetical protein
MGDSNPARNFKSGSGAAARAEFAAGAPTVEFPEFSALDHVCEVANTGHA